MSKSGSFRSLLVDILLSDLEQFENNVFLALCAIKVNYLCIRPILPYVSVNQVLCNFPPEVVRKYQEINTFWFDASLQVIQDESRYTTLTETVNSLKKGAITKYGKKYIKLAELYKEKVDREVLYIPLGNTEYGVNVVAIFSKHRFDRDDVINCHELAWLSLGTMKNRFVDRYGIQGHVKNLKILREIGADRNISRRAIMVKVDLKRNEVDHGIDVMRKFFGGADNAGLERKIMPHYPLFSDFMDSLHPEKQNSG